MNGFIQGPRSLLRRVLGLDNGEFSPTEAVDWQEDADRAYIEQNPLRARTILYVIAGVLVALLLWSAFATVDEVTRGTAKVIPSRQVQVMQSLDGGVITDIHIREGELVEPGQLLVSLDTTRFQSRVEENRAELQALRARAERLSAIANDRDFQPDEQLVAAVPDVVAQEQTLYQSTLQQLRGEMTIAEQQLEQRQRELQEARVIREQSGRAYELVSREVALTRPLVGSGAVSEVELLRLEREMARLLGERDSASAQIQRLEAAIAESEGRVADVRLRFVNDIREQLAEVSARISGLEQASVGLSDQVKQAEIRAQVRGTVNRLYFNTIGGVVVPGKEVVEIVPIDDTLLLEARINPKDIAFLRPGQEALVKFTAYDFVVYGGLDGVVEQIGADTLTDEQGNPFYLVRIRTHESSLGEDKPIIPGMVAEVDILTGKKTILAYLMKPILRAKQYALTER